ACGISIDPSVVGMPTIVRSCGNTSFVYTDSPMTACALGLRSFTRTFIVTDANGNTESCTQIITLEDNIAPIFNGALPANMTVSCEADVPAAAQMTATDNCGNAVVTFTETRVNGTCDNNFVLTRIW